MRLPFPALVIITCFALVASGCGYHLGEIRPTTMRSVKYLAVPTAKNQTYQPRVGVLLADSVIRKLQADGTYEIVGTERSDAIVYVTLNKAERRPIRSVVSNVLQTSEYELILHVSYEVQDRISGAVLLSGRVTGSTTFFPTGDLQTDENQAVSVAASRAADSLASRLSEGW